MTTRKQAREIADKIAESKYWLIITLDDQGTGLHLKEPSHLSLIAHLFRQAPEIQEKTIAILQEMEKMANDNRESI